MIKRMKVAHDIRAKEMILIRGYVLTLVALSIVIVSGALATRQYELLLEQERTEPPEIVYVEVKVEVPQECKARPPEPPFEDIIEHWKWKYRLFQTPYHYDRFQDKEAGVEFTWVSEPFVRTRPHFSARMASLSALISATG
ncbi:hypothetical protein ACFLRO_00500 [Bacteroidota bacterium]